MNELNRFKKLADRDSGGEHGRDDTVKFNLEKVKESYERAIERSTLKVSNKFSKIFHDRIRYLIAQLEPEFKVRSLRMGMGAWTFESEPFEIEYEDGSIGLTEENPNDLLYGKPCFDDLLERNFNYCWTPSRAEKRHWEIFDELREILDYLNEDNYLELLKFDLENKT